MALNKPLLSVLSAMSQSNTDITKIYKFHRQFKNLTPMIVDPNKCEISDTEFFLRDHKVLMRKFVPVGVDIRGVLLFIHGGGWVVDSVKSYTTCCATLAEETENIVMSIDYRLAPENKFPDGFDDCYAIAKEVYCNGFIHGINTEEVTIIGDSAGGNLAAAISLRARDEGLFAVPRQILIYPSVGYDYSENSPFKSVVENGADYLLTREKIAGYRELYMRDEKDKKNPYFAPIVAEDFSNQPKTLIITAEFCPLRDEGEYYGKLLEEAGNSVEIHRMPNGVHGYFTLPRGIKIVEDTYEIIKKFLKE